ncbi:CCA tRNA nucleotidyltransferase [Pacificibacter marinus]|uniref:CCA tRNA nucleotidyltransferase n=1 Tax=Pacificibacter marinus TaxID=658057 RepID=UPI00339D6114
MKSVKTYSWFQAEVTQTVIKMFKSADQSAYFVGGCIRNSLMGVPVTDLDISTPMRPEAVMKLAKSAGFKAIPTGIEHGTITVIAGGEPFEITTFRRDVATDGRRAVVAFSDSLEEDACRRDFTMNALYVDLDGVVLDPLGGMADLRARKVRFIGVPQDRIREDYLRILRFFRFHATYGDADAGLDADALAGCAENLDGLSGLSKERVGSEIIKLLSARDPSASIGGMEMTGVLQAILPGASGRSFYPYVSQEFHIDPMARLAALGGEDAGPLLKLSRKQSVRLAKFKDAMGHGRSVYEIAFVEGADMALCIAALRAAVFEQPLQTDVREQILTASKQVFPVRAQDLMPEYTGAELGEALKTLQHAWLASGFALTKAKLMQILETKST